MFYVYFIQSSKNKSVYVGSTSDLRKRIVEHNEGMTPSTKGLRPYQLLYYEAYNTKRLALKREIELKKSWSKKEEVLKRVLEVV